MWCLVGDTCLEIQNTFLELESVKTENTLPSRSSSSVLPARSALLAGAGEGAHGHEGAMGSLLMGFAGEEEDRGRLATRAGGGVAGFTWRWRPANGEAKRMAGE